MEIKYKIIGIDPTQHSITVRYYTDLFSEDILATSFNSDGSIARNENGSPLRCQTDYNINIWKTNPPPTLDDIKSIANNSAPFDWFSLKHDVLNSNIDTSLSIVSSILNQEFVAERPVLSMESIESMENLENTGNENTENENIENEIQKIIDSLIENSSSNNS